MQNDLARIQPLCFRGIIVKPAFVIYGCPYSALATTKALEAFVVPEPDRSLFHFRHNTNRILNLVGFSGLRDIRLVGCSPEFSDEFKALVRGRPQASFRISDEPKTCTQFNDAEIVGEDRATYVIVVE